MSRSTRIAAAAWCGLLLVLPACLLGGCGGDSAESSDAADASDAGAAWRPAFDPGPRGAVLSVFGPRADAIYAVGGQPEAGAAWRFDGAAWAPLEVPAGPLLNWIHGANDTLFLVGNAGRFLRRVADGPFEALETGETQALWGVFAVAPDDVFVVGGEASAAAGLAPTPVLMHFNGHTFTHIPIPPVDRPFRALFKIWAAGAADVFAVGQAGVILERRGGADWRQVPSGTAQDLISLWGTGPARVAAVGGRGFGVVARFDGAAWHTETALELGSGVPAPGLNGAHMDADGTLWAVGDRGAIVRFAPDAPRFERQPNDDETLLHAVFSAPDGHRVAGGGTLLERPPWAGVALELVPTARE